MVLGLKKQGNRGRKLEEIIEIALHLAARRGLPVYFLHQTNQWIPLKNGKAFPRKGAPIDFVGAVEGVPVALECKEVGEGSRFPLNTSRLPEKEIEAMKGFEAAGGKTFLVIAFWERKIITLVPFDEIKKALQDYRQNRGAASIGVEFGIKIPEERVIELGEVILQILRSERNAGVQQTKASSG